MDIRIGDTVRFISEKLEGKVTGIIDTNTVNVYCEEYGFEIPGNTNDLVVVQSDFISSATEKKGKNTSNVSVIPTDILFIGIVPDNFQNLAASRFEIYLINDTASTCLYSAGYFNGEKYTALSAGNCNPDTTILLGTYTLKELDSVKSLHIQAIYYKKGNYSPRPVIDTHVKLNLTSLCKTGNYKHTKWFGPMSFLKPLDQKQAIEEIEIDPEELIQAEKVKKAAESVKRPQKQIVNNVVEIDLHCDQILETTAGMGNKDILEYQLDVFRKTLDEYKLRRGQKIVFIHGKGDGILRQRILWELQTKYKRFHHQDASFKQYGYGATLVTIK